MQKKNIKCSETTSGTLLGNNRFRFSIALYFGYDATQSSNVNVMKAGMK